MMKNLAIKIFFKWLYDEKSCTKVFFKWLISSSRLSDNFLISGKKKCFGSCIVYYVDNGKQQIKAFGLMQPSIEPAIFLPWSKQADTGISVLHNK